MEYPADKMLEMYALMFKIRLFEESSTNLYQRGFIRGAVHPYIGEEAVAVGACFNLRNDDFITSTHRGHGHCIAKGGDIKKMMAELLGKSTGYCKGKGGSMHIANLDMGNLGANGIVSAGVGIATGAGLSIKMQEKDLVVLSFFGDGAINQGIFHESLNMASIWKLPVVYICENNIYAVSSYYSIMTPFKNISDRAWGGYKIPSEIVDGNDVLAVFEVIQKAVERARNGMGPTFVEAKTYRWTGHYIGDPAKYRTEEELKSWKNRCPIENFKKMLINHKVTAKERIEEIENDISIEINEAINFAMESPEPKESDIFDDLYS